MKELFTMCDTDGDGELTKIELGKVMKDLGMVFNDNELETMFHQLDTDNNGSVSCVEFVRGLRFMEKSRRLAKVADKRGIKRENSVSAFVEMLSEEQVEEMHKLFQMIDKNNDGIIVKRELAQVMKEMGLSPTKEEFDELFTNLDTNGDGKIEFQEFLGGMRWLKKGSIINSYSSPKTCKKLKNSGVNKATIEMNERSVSNLQERNTILERYLKETVTRGMNLAEEHFRKKEYDLCKIALDTIDLETVMALEVFVGPLTTEKQKDHFQKMQRRLNTLS
eukprot:TRINITY_DN2942_c0_g1_i13.p1 TRINITY_DN2942_c0_g1~~TRINITY_DN2942_c0_g1_i13.p1  ORF type:complete len:278 (+),score=81.55 TRINITY_DN2942_c0_g1_i13:250-1083(+)